MTLLLNKLENFSLQRKANSLKTNHLEHILSEYSSHMDLTERRGKQHNAQPYFAEYSCLGQSRG